MEVVIDERGRDLQDAERAREVAERSLEGAISAARDAEERMKGMQSDLESARQAASEAEDLR